MEQIYIDTLAYMETPSGSGAQVIATFANEELYSQCAPIIEAWLAKQGDYKLTESCELGITTEVET